MYIQHYVKNLNKKTDLHKSIENQNEFFKFESHKFSLSTYKLGFNNATW